MKKNKLFTCRLFFLLLVIIVGFWGCKKKGFSASAINGEISALEEFRAIKLKKSVDVSKSTINYFDVDSYDTSKFKAKDDGKPFKIVDYGPVDELPVEMKRPTIYVMFSHPVVPLGKLGDVVKDSLIMNIDPNVDGIFRWYGTKLLSFEPSQKYLPQRIYRISIAKETKSIFGKKIEGNRKFEFHTEFLDIANFHTGSTGEHRRNSLYEVPLKEAKKITINFTYPVNLDVIKDYLKVVSLGKEYAFNLSRPKKEKYMDDNYIQRSVVLNVKEKFNENSKVEITLLKGARSEKEFIGREKEIKKNFHTITPFKFKHYDTSSYSFPRSEKGDVNPVYLTFSIR